MTLSNRGWKIGQALCFFAAFGAQGASRVVPELAPAAPSTIAMGALLLASAYCASRCEWTLFDFMHLPAGRALYGKDEGMSRFRVRSALWVLGFIFVVVGIVGLFR